MTGYGLIIILILIIFIGAIYDVEPAVRDFVYRITDMPGIDIDNTENPQVFAFAIRATYLITFIAILKLIFRRPKDDEE